MLTIQLFGRFRVEHNRIPLRGLSALKAQELFCYLLLHRDRDHSRERLASLLWGDSTTSQSKSYLRKALWQLQLAVKPFIQIEKVNLFSVDRDWIRLNITSNVIVDVAIFEEAITSVNGLRGEQLITLQANTLRNALDLYEKDLLEGWYQDWCIAERDRFQQMCITLLGKLIDYYEAHKEYETAIDYGKRILSYDSFHEPTNQQLMRLHYLNGDRTQALRLYEHYVAELAEEFDAMPGLPISSFYEQIRLGQPLEHSSSVLETHDGLSVVDRLAVVTEAIGHLQQLQEALTEIRSDLQREAHLTETALSDQSRWH